MVMCNVVVGSITLPGDSVTAEMENARATFAVDAVSAQRRAIKFDVVFM
jgi:hypothetical protein